MDAILDQTVTVQDLIEIDRQERLCQMAVLTSADSIQQLRRCDVHRVLDENQHIEGLAGWIKKHRPDLVREIDGYADASSN